jgi:hypothetical protein
MAGSQGLTRVGVSERLGDVAAVMEAARSERAVLFGYRGAGAVAELPGVLATFDGPGREVRCAQALLARASAAPGGDPVPGLDRRVGIDAVT